jgi:putative aminopeptidase FrvX
VAAEVVVVVVATSVAEEEGLAGVDTSEAASMVAVLVAVDTSEAAEASMAVAVVVSAGRRTSQAGPRASEAEACHSQAELAGHRSDRTSLRGPAG